MVSQPPMAYEVIAAGDTEAIGLVLKGSEIQATQTASVQVTRQPRPPLWSPDRALTKLRRVSFCE